MFWSPCHPSRCDFFFWGQAVTTRSGTSSRRAAGSWLSHGRDSQFPKHAGTRMAHTGGDRHGCGQIKICRVWTGKKCHSQFWYVLVRFFPISGFMIYIVVWSVGGWLGLEIRIDVLCFYRRLKSLTLKPLVNLARSEDLWIATLCALGTFLRCVAGVWDDSGTGAIWGCGILRKNSFKMSTIGSFASVGDPPSWMASTAEGLRLGLPSPAALRAGARSGAPLRGFGVGLGTWFFW